MKHFFNGSQGPNKKETRKMSTQRKFGSRRGATFIEYALLAGLVAIVVAAAAMFFGDDLKQLFGATGSQTESVTTNVKSVDLTSTLKDAGNKSGQQGGGGQKKGN